MNQPTTKQELLDQAERAHQDMMRFLAALSDEEKTAPILDEGWSIKDSLAHLIVWEKMTMDWIGRSARGEEVKRFIPGFIYETDDQRVPVMEKLNEHLYEESKRRPLDDVMQDFRATHRVMLNFIESLDERDIFDPDRFAWRKGSPAFDALAGNTYEHYDEHKGWMAQGLKRN